MCFLSWQEKQRNAIAVDRAMIFTPSSKIKIIRFSEEAMSKTLATAENSISPLLTSNTAQPAQKPLWDCGTGRLWGEINTLCRRLQMKEISRRDFRIRWERWCRRPEDRDKEEISAARAPCRQTTRDPLGRTWLKQCSGKWRRWSLWWRTVDSVWSERSDLIFQESLKWN